MKKLHASIKKELVLGCVIIMLLCGAFTTAGILFFSRSNFDTLVQQSDIEIAKSVTRSIAPFYTARGSWNGIESEVEILRSTFLQQNVTSESRNFKDHGQGGGKLPLVITDELGRQVYPTNVEFERKFSRDPDRLRPLKKNDGVNVIVEGKIVGYVYFKSMLQLEYNPHEAVFLRSLGLSISVSVFLGIIFAVVLGSFFATKLVRPIIDLDEAVTKFAMGESGVRTRIARNDEIGRLAGSFNGMAEKIESTERARKNLLADIAHELRTPVSIIQANLEMMLEGLYAPDKERLFSLHGETQNLSALINDLREISDLESGIVKFNFQPVRLYPLIIETCEKYRPLFDEKDISIDLLPFDGECEYVNSDENRLRQVVRNILMNAFKYSSEKSSVSVSCERLIRDNTTYLAVTVSDEGPGVPESDLEKIFERFYRVDSSRNRDSGGRGLGLAICKQFLEESGGIVFARNRITLGLAVRFELPVCSSRPSQ